MSLPLIPRLLARLPLAVLRRLLPPDWEEEAAQGLRDWLSGAQPSAQVIHFPAERRRPGNSVARSAREEEA